jgi:MFS family permease
METQLHAGLSTVQWVINAYALIFGVAIITGGRLADMFGRRRTFSSARRSSPCSPWRAASPPTR